MRDIGERAAVHEGRVVLKRLHEVWLHRVFEQYGHRTIRLDVAAEDRRAVAAVGDDHVAQTLLQVRQIARQTQDRHDLGGHGDVKARLAWEAIGHAAQARGDLA